VATPVNWSSGDDVVILPTFLNAEAEALFPQGWNAVKPGLQPQRE
jgi:hypothetical protein